MRQIDGGRKSGGVLCSELDFRYREEVARQQVAIAVQKSVATFNVARFFKLIKRAK